jgi:hypothetical protein
MELSPLSSLFTSLLFPETSKATGWDAMCMFSKANLGIDNAAFSKYTTNHGYILCGASI